ncbi:helix-turn-helix domain-containing protein [Streptococcus ruminantium]|uniref:helix-turn-helix domain-containing protein n=1 Tax=Streptococcus ruminantium TaxID=1917441 RepID=UPI0012DCC592|nr:helix-turn-helix domain-containing protein [Streptococcus ruminantium]
MISLKRFIIENYYEILKSKSEEFIGNRVPEVFITEVSIQQVYAGFTDDDFIEVDVVVSVSYQEIFDGFPLNLENKWLRHCGILILTDKNCACDFYGIAPYEKGDKNLFKFPISDTLLPYLSKDNSEIIATKFLEKYYPEALEEPMLISTDILVKRIGLSIIERNIYSEYFWGRIYFYDNSFYDILKGTIVINPLHAYWKRNSLSVRSTIIHECVHWVYARHSIYLSGIYKKNHLETKEFSLTSLVERQANELSPKILMPRKAVEIKLNELIDEFLETDEHKYQFASEFIVNKIATFFGVSKLSARIRLGEIGYEGALGAYEYIDGHYLPTHSWLKGFLEKNQTFSISNDDKTRLLQSNPEVNKLYLEGKLLYVESHLCLNNPLYIQCNAFGEYFLTDYARSHMEECCLVFEVSFLGDNYNYRYDSLYLLNRKTNPKLEYCLKVPATKNKNIIDFCNEEIDILKNIPNSFNEALIFLMNKYGFTIDKLSEVTLLSNRQITRLRKGESNPKLETLVAICIGMKFPPQISKRLIYLSGLRLRDFNELEYLYLLFLHSPDSFGVFKCNEILKKAGFKELVPVNE